jgi:hypothetical protein
MAGISSIEELNALFAGAAAHGAGAGADAPADAMSDHANVALTSLFALPPQPPPAPAAGRAPPAAPAPPRPMGLDLMPDNVLVGCSFCPRLRAVCALPAGKQAACRRH